MVSGNSVVFQIGKETTYGTAATGTEQIRIASESMKPTYNKIDEGLATGNVGAGKVQTVGINCAGSVATIFRPDMGLILKALCGAEGTVSGSGPYKHTFTPIGNGLTDKLPSLTLLVDRKAAVCAYPGAKIGQMTFDASAGGYLNVSIDFVAKDEVDGTMASSLSPSALEGFTFASGKLLIDEEEVEITSSSVTWNNGLVSDKQTSKTGLYNKEPVQGMRTVTGNSTMDYDGDAEALRSTLYKSDTVFGLELVYTSDEETESGSGTHYQLKIIVPAAQCTDSGANMGSPTDSLSMNFDWKAVQGTGSYCTIELTNDDSTQY